MKKLTTLRYWIFHPFNIGKRQLSAWRVLLVAWMLHDASPEAYFAAQSLTLFVQSCLCAPKEFTIKACLLTLPTQLIIIEIPTIKIRRRGSTFRCLRKLGVKCGIDVWKSNMPFCVFVRWRVLVYKFGKCYRKEIFA